VKQKKLPPKAAPPPPCSVCGEQSSGRCDHRIGRFGTCRTPICLCHRHTTESRWQGTINWLRLRLRLCPEHGNGL
jgi:hypothetical protein